MAVNNQHVGELVLANGFRACLSQVGFRDANDVKVVGDRVIDARIDDAINSGDATTDGVITAMRDALVAHGLLASS